METTHLHYPVSAEFTADGWESPGLDYSDYTRMSTHTHKLDSCRQIETPAWALNDHMLRKLLVRCCELRAGFYRPQPGSDEIRLQRAQHFLEHNVRPRQIATLEGLCRKYVTLKREGQSVRQLEIQIENLDTSLCISSRIPTIVAGLAYYYYRLGWDSVAVAQQLGLKPVHVRVWLSRLHGLWTRMQAPGPERKAEPIPKTLRPHVRVPDPAGIKRPRGRPRKVTQESAVVPAQGFGVSVDKAWASGATKVNSEIFKQNYASYIQLAAKYKVAPLPFDLWSLLQPECYAQELQPGRMSFDAWVKGKVGRPVVDVTGMQFASWKVLGFKGLFHGEAQWLCQCVCGKQSAVLGSDLRQGGSTQCRSCAARKGNARRAAIAAPAGPAEQTARPESQSGMPSPATRLGNPRAARSFCSAA